MYVHHPLWDPPAKKEKETFPIFKEAQKESKLMTNRERGKLENAELRAREESKRGARKRGQQYEAQKGAVEKWGGAA